MVNTRSSLIRILHVSSVDEVAEVQNVIGHTERTDTDDEVPGEIDIVWLRDPLTFRYLRESQYMTTWRRGQIRRPYNGILVGYAVQRKHGQSVQAYVRRYWWLKNHDRDLDHGGVYGADTWARGPAPTEAVVPESVSVGCKSEQYRSSVLAREDVVRRWPVEARAAGVVK